MIPSAAHSDRDLAQACHRRATPLAVKLAAQIRSGGPITVADYMAACLFDPDHGYYVKQPAIGATGDFVTAPEITQVFGELIGLWTAVTWHGMGSPSPFNLVEYGPGRGTLMADALRALAKVPDCLAAANVCLVEVSPALRDIQQRHLQADRARITWHRSVRGEVEPLPSIVIANEVLDTAPVAQYVAVGDQLFERCVTLDPDGTLDFCLRSPDGTLAPDQPTSIVERRPLHPIISRDLTAMPACSALLIDYGHARTAPGDTLQAVRQHAYESPLASPGEADLTAQVDFGALAAQCRDSGFSVDGPITQAEFLAALGITERASRLMSANPQRAIEIEAGIARLMSPTGMGSRFRALGLRSPGSSPLPGFPRPHPG